MTSSNRPQPVSGGSASGGTKTWSIVALVLGVLSLVFGQTVILPIVAIILGFVARSREPAGRTIALWAIILGFIALFGWILLALLGVVVLLPFLF